MTRHQPTEELLDRHDATWTYNEHLALDRIDTDLSAREQYRGTTTAPQVVSRYRQAMTDGWGDFPPVIVRRQGDRHVLVGGMHRTAAAEAAGLTTCPAYLVDCDDRTALLVALEDNARHGQPLSNRDRAEMAARLVAIHQVPVAQAAATVGVTRDKVDIALQARRAVDRAARHGVDLYDATHQLAASLGRLRDDDLFAAACRATVDRNMGGGSVARMVTQVQNASSKDEALERIAAIADARQDHEGGRGHKRTARIRLLDALFDLLDADPDQVAADTTPEAAGPDRDRLVRAARHLMAIDHAIARQGRGAA